MKPVAHIRTAFKSKFGIPRQSGLVDGLRGEIVFCPEYRNVEALRGLDGFSHIWLLWDFSEAPHDEGQWSPTVRPPRLGGNRRMGVWATRSPFRPNNIGLSSVRLVEVRLSTPDGPMLVVEGADLMDGTPIFDIKPYLPFTDCHPDARGGFAEEQMRATQPLAVDFPQTMQEGMTQQQVETLTGVLAADPRPQYHADPSRIYVMEYDGREVSFRVDGGRLTVVAVAHRP